MKILSLSPRWELVIPGDAASTITYCLTHFVSCYEEAIKHHGMFFVALSGGSTPKAIFEKLCQSPYKELIDFSKVYLFWSDERSVSSASSDSNYHMAMEAGFKYVGIPKEHIFRMQAEDAIEKHALDYEKTIQTLLKDRPFDLIMLGMGDDGHTASLFPGSQGLHENKRLVIANYIPQKSTWRMTMTFKQINHAHHIVIYVMGASKQPMLKKVLAYHDHPSFEYPITHVGTKQRKALWIADSSAAQGVI